MQREKQNNGEESEKNKPASVCEYGVKCNVKHKDEEGKDRNIGKY